jgi:DNA repair protein RecO (recombination protein O)
MSSPGDDDRRWRTFRLEAVVLRHNNWGETDRLLGLFSRQMGRLRAIAKGVRKPGSRKAGHLEPFTRVNLLLARGREIPIITQAETLDAYLPLHDDLLRTTYALYVIELVDRFTYEEGENRGLYRLLVNTLTRLCQPVDLDLVVRYYEVRLLDFVGFRPQLFNCISCGEQILPRDQFFSPQQGGVLCPPCGARMNQNHLSREQPISMPVLKYLRHFQRSNFSEASRASPTPQVAREMEIVMQLYLTHLLERKLNTPSFLRRVRLGVQMDMTSESDEAAQV